LVEYLLPSLRDESYILDESGGQGEKPFYLKIKSIYDFFLKKHEGGLNFNNK